MTLAISSPGISPSNRNAGFPNLARRDASPYEVDRVTAACLAELEAAGIGVHDYPHILMKRGEVPSLVMGTLSMWRFTRAWYYWIAEGPGIPPDVAENLHATHGTQVRVAGHCGCPSPREWFKGFAVGSYHVDTPDGLKALADAIKSVAIVSLTPPPSPTE